MSDSDEGSLKRNQAEYCETRSWLTPWKRLSWLERICLPVVGLIPVVGGAIIGYLTSTDSYRQNNFISPPWRPPSSLFAPVWTFLYLAMGLASLLVYVYGGGLNKRTLVPLLLYAAQLGLNFAWTPVFFTARLPCAALLMIGMIWALVLACILTFWGHNKLASILLLPYLVWLSFASALNYSITALNGCPRLPDLPSNATTTTAFPSTTTA